MTEQVTQPEHDREIAAELRLRHERPPVTRLSRRILIGLGAVASLAISGALIWALSQGHRKTNNATELYNTGSGTFTQTGSMEAVRVLPAAVLLQDGRVLVSGGSEINSAELYK